MHPAVNKLVAPGQKRPGIWRGGILQVMITRKCDASCVHCTQGSNLAGRYAEMTVDEADEAFASLESYPGVVGLFGGNPAVHKDFDKICERMRARIPFEQRGLWSNRLFGKGAVARITFNPKHSNINVHLNSEAADEIRRDWPEASSYVKGEHEDSTHGAPFVALKDVEPDEEKRWALIAECDVSRWWSACIGTIPGRGLRGYFCELAYAQAALHCDDPDWPDVGSKIEPRWWDRPMSAFEAQVNLHCHSCGIPLRRPGQPAVTGSFEEFSPTHASIARPKTRGRQVHVVESIGVVERSGRPATEYLPGTTPKVKA